MKNYAVIDIGSLKTKLLVANVHRKKVNILEKESELTLMGKGLKEKDHMILEKPLKKTIKSVSKYMKIIQKLNVEKVKIIATESFRKAKNLEKALRKFKYKIGMKPEIISQEDEAKVYFKAITWNMKSTDDIVLIDIGGGSVQVLYGNKNKLKKIYFLPLGTYYIHQNFIKDNSEKGKATKKELQVIRDHIKRSIQELKLLHNTKVPLVYGSSNILDLFKFLNFPMNRTDISINHKFIAKPEELIKFLKKIENLNHKQREVRYPFQYGFMWGIQIAFYTAYYLAQFINTKEIVPSNVNIAEGYIIDNFL